MALRITTSDADRSLALIDFIESQRHSSNFLKNTLSARVAVLALICFEVLRIARNISSAVLKLPIAVTKLVLDLTPLKILPATLGFTYVGVHLRRSLRSLGAICLDAPRIAWKPERALELYRANGLIATPVARPSWMERMRLKLMTPETQTATAVVSLILAGLGLSRLFSSHSDFNNGAPSIPNVEEVKWGWTQYGLIAGMFGTIVLPLFFKNQPCNCRDKEIELENLSGGYEKVGMTEHKQGYTHEDIVINARVPTAQDEKKGNTEARLEGIYVEIFKLANSGVEGDTPFSRGDKINKLLKACEARLKKLSTNPKGAQGFRLFLELQRSIELLVEVAPMLKNADLNRALEEIKADRAGKIFKVWGRCLDDLRNKPRQVEALYTLNTLQQCQKFLYANRADLDAILWRSETDLIRIRESVLLLPSVNEAGVRIKNNTSSFDDYFLTLTYALYGDSYQTRKSNRDTVRELKKTMERSPELDLLHKAFDELTPREPLIEELLCIQTSFITECVKAREYLRLFHAHSKKQFRKNGQWIKDLEDALNVMQKHEEEIRKKLQGVTQDKEIWGIYWETLSKLDDKGTFVYQQNARSLGSRLFAAGKILDPPKNNKKFVIDNVIKKRKQAIESFECSTAFNTWNLNNPSLFQWTGLSRLPTRMMTGLKGLVAQ